MCSSDLTLKKHDGTTYTFITGTQAQHNANPHPNNTYYIESTTFGSARSEERRVGKESRSRWSAYTSKTKESRTRNSKSRKSQNTHQANT